MFTKNSRYASSPTYATRTARGTTVTAVRLPVRAAPLVRGFHLRTEGQRLDHVANYYLADATAFWRLCEAGDAIVPDALATRDRVAIPKQER